MKTTTRLLSMLALALLALLGLRLGSAAPATLHTYEYAILRWDGKEHTHFIRPNGQVEFLGPLLLKVQRPDKVDERALLLTLAINAVALQGFEVVSATPEMILFKRPLNP